MTLKKKNIDVKVKKKSLLRKLSKIFLVILLFLVSFSVTLIIISQFKFFREFALNKIVSIVNNQLIAKIEIDDLSLWSPAGIKFFGVRLLTDGDTLANIPEMSLNLSYEALFNQQVSVNRLVLKNPKIRLLRNSSDSLWNYDKIAPPSEDTTDTGPSPWQILVRRLELKNADFLYYDSTVTYVNYGTMDYKHIRLDDFDLLLSAEINLEKNDFSANIRRLRANEMYSELQLHQFAGKLRVSENIIYAKDLHCKINESEFYIGVEMRKFNVFSKIKPEIEDAEFSLSMRGVNIGDEEVYKFAVIPISFGSRSDIFINAIGNLNDLDIKNLRLITGKSDIQINGNLQNLLDIDDFEYEFSLDNTKITRTDIITTLKSLDLSGIPEFNSATMDLLYVRGFIDSVYSDMTINTDIGKIKGKAGVHYGSNELRYSADISFQGVNLQPILRDNTFKSNLNGELKFAGQGVDIKNIKSNLSAKFDNSEIHNVRFKHLITDIAIKDKIVNVNSVDIELYKSGFTYDPQYDVFGLPKIRIGGLIDFTDMNIPGYKINLRLDEVDLNNVLGINTLPDYISGDILIDMKSFELDKLNGSLSAEIEGLGYDDRYFLPFSIDAEFDISDSLNKKINFNSDFFKVDISGDFNFTSLLNRLTEKGQLLGGFVSEKLDSFNPQKLIRQDSSIIVENAPEKIYSYPEMNVKLSADIKDMSSLNIFLDSLNIYSSISIDGQLISDDDLSTLFLDSIKIDYFDLKTPDLILKTNSINFEGRLITRIKDSLETIENVSLNLDTLSLLKIDELEISKLYSSVNFDSKVAKFNLGLVVNDDINFDTKGEFHVGLSDLKLIADTLNVSYMNTFSWYAPKPIVLNSYPNKIEVSKFLIERKNAERILLSGNIDNDVANNLNLFVTNLALTDFLKLADENVRKQYSGAKLTLDSLRIRANGALHTPRIITSLFADSIIFNNYRIGTLNSRLIHNQTYMHGFVDINTPMLDNRKTFGIDINYFPLYLGTNANIQRFDSTKQFDIRLKTLGLPLELIAPFVPGIRDLSGFANANIVVEGSMKDGVVYGGSIKSENARLKVENTNINYLADVEINFNKDKITLSKVDLRNIQDDSRFGRIGRANVSGSVAMNGIEIGELDIRVEADRLLVMSDATMVTMPDLYGDFILSTDNNPLRFYGTLDKPNLDGDVNIMYAHLKMPMEQKRQVVRTYFTYQTIGDKVRLHSSTTRLDDTLSTEKTEKDTRLGPNIADLINYNLTARILGRFIVEMDMSLIGSMFAVIGTTDRTQSLRYVKKRDSDEAQLFGQVVVKDESTIKSWKQFTTSGTISFPAGSIENPSLDLSAIHSGTMLDNDDRKQFVVKMTITGSQSNPKVLFTYFIDGVEASGSQEQINEDALYLLVMGRTKSGTGGGMNNSNLLNEGFASGVSNFATKALSELLMGTGVINSAEFDFQGGSMNLGDATLRLSGQLYGGISWTIGGTVADLSSNNQITIDIPASEFSNNPFWSNFVLQLSKASSNIMANSQEAKNWEVKIKLGSSW